MLPTLQHGAHVDQHQHKNLKLGTALQQEGNNDPLVESGGFISAQFTLSRTGERSVYGEVDYICNPGSGEYHLKSMRGIAVYSELNLRDFSVRVEKPLDKPRCSVLRVTFTPTDGFVGERQDVLAQAQVAVR